MAAPYAGIRNARATIRGIVENEIARTWRVRDGDRTGGRAAIIGLVGGSARDRRAVLVRPRGRRSISTVPRLETREKVCGYKGVPHAGYIQSSL